MISNRKKKNLLFHFLLFFIIINADYIYGLFAEHLYLYNLRNILFSFLFMSIVFNIIRNKKEIEINRNMMFIVIFLVYCFLSWGLVSSAPVYGMYKLTGCFLAIFLAFVPNFMNYTVTEIKNFYKYYLYFGLVLALLMLVLSGNSFTSFNTRLVIGEINPIWLSRFFGELIILILFLFKFKYNTLLKTCLIGLLSIGLILTGSKGPILSLVLAVLIVKILSEKIEMNKSRVFKKYFSFLSLLVAVLIFIRYVVLKVFSLDYLALRFVISNSETSYGDYSRTNLFESALNFSYQNPFFGNGLGSFGIMYKGEDVRDYPHNVFLETLSELGLLGLILLIIPIFLTFIKFYKYSKISNNLYLKLTMTLFIYYFFNSMVSGDLGFSNLKLFLFMGIVNYMFIGTKNYNKKLIYNEQLVVDKNQTIII